MQEKRLHETAGGKMSINVCENHDDAVCIWSYGRECPLCNVISQVESLKEQLEKEQDATENALDRLTEVQAELTAATKE